MKEYILNLLEKERSTIEELLFIDNKVQSTNYTYEYIYNLVYSTNIVNNNLKDKYIVITDGELNTIINIVINYYDNIYGLNINHMTLGFNNWLISKVNSYNENINILLDINNSYEEYFKFNNFIIGGYLEFIEGTSDMFEDKNIIKVVIE